MPQWWKDVPFFKGVNLGSWFVLERWQEPSVFITDTEDEFGLSESLGTRAESHIRSHRENYITRKDLEWLRNAGINAVRIPIGYWVLDTRKNLPFVASPDLLDAAMKLCEELGLYVVFSLHSLPGHQSPDHTTGRKNHWEWGRYPKWDEPALNFVEEVAERYSGNRMLSGICVVNEPSQEIPAETLLKFYRKAYARIRKHCSYERVAVVVPIFTEHRRYELGGRLLPHEFENVIEEYHLYQCFGEWWSKRGSVIEHCREAFKREDILKGDSNIWNMVGEWSLRLPWNPEITRNLPDADRDIAMRAYATAQLLAYQKTGRGWFFWSYKACSQEPEWSFRESVERGWLPNRYG